MTEKARKARAMMKEKYPDAIVLMREGDFYRVYEEDAVKANQAAGVQYSTIEGVNVGVFPHYSLDKVLPNLIRAGYRCGICDDASEPIRKVRREGFRQ